MHFPCSSAHMADFLHFLPFSVFKPQYFIENLKEFFLPFIYRESLTMDLFFRRTIFLNPISPSSSQVNAAFFIIPAWQGDWGFWESSSDSLPQTVWHLHKETWHIVPHKGLPTFPRTEKDREYSWVRLLTTIKKHFGTKGFFFLQLTHFFLSWLF